MGYTDGFKYEKDFNLKLSRDIYNHLKELGFPVFMTRNDDSTISNYDRYDYLVNVLKDSGGKSLILSIHIDNERREGIEIIYSILKDKDDNIELYHKLNDITNVTTKTLPTDENKDYYAIQRIAPSEADVLVLEFGYDYVKATDEQITELANEIVDVIVDTLSDGEMMGYEDYVVQNGDNLYELSQRYDVTVDELKMINNMGTDQIDIGQILKVPRQKKKYYIVMKGDSLYSIAKKFDTTVDKIKDINNLISNKLSVNQKLLIPN